MANHYEMPNAHKALCKQLSDDRDLAAEPASFTQRAKKWSFNISQQKRRISDAFYGESVTLGFVSRHEMGLFILNK